MKETTLEVDEERWDVRAAANWESLLLKSFATRGAAEQWATALADQGLACALYLQRATRSQETIAGLHGEHAETIREWLASFTPP